MNEPNLSQPAPIPRFANQAEMGDFWDTHSPEDFPDEFEDVQAAISPRRRTRVLAISSSARMQIQPIPGNGDPPRIRPGYLTYFRA
ncbi:MAG: hypothetical protein ACRDIY_19650 [Chloroflexota bacterium]